MSRIFCLKFALCFNLLHTIMCMFSLETETNLWNGVTCKRINIDQIIAPVIGCPSRYLGIEYGLSDPRNRKAYVIGEACYSTQEGRTIFIHQKILQNYCPKYQLIPGKLPVYNAKYFKKRRPSDHHLQQFRNATQYRSMKSHFHKLDIVPKDLKVRLDNYIDSVYMSFTYFQSLHSFVWNQFVMLNVDDSNLKVLQTDIILQRMIGDIDFYTGSHGVVLLPTVKGSHAKLYLMENKRFPIPRFIWVLVKRKTKAVVFVYLNNPNASIDEVDNMNVCASKCDKISWIHKLRSEDRYKDPSNGFIWCCEYKEVINRITEIPKQITVEDLFIE